MNAVFLSQGWQTNFLGIATSERMARKMVRDYNRKTFECVLPLRREFYEIHAQFKKSDWEIYRELHISWEGTPNTSIQVIPCLPNTVILNQQIFGE